MFLEMMAAMCWFKVMTFSPDASMRGSRCSAEGPSSMVTTSSRGLRRGGRLCGWGLDWGPPGAPLGSPAGP
uniref:Putative secreted protein n=1 Tax=Ixodes ricinus TaxID=34613 RepID=A0A6B0TRZ4_IXORI